MSVNRTIENVYIRQEAVQLTRRNFWRLLVMTVIVSLVNEGLNWALTAAGDALMLPETTELISAVSALSASGRLTSSEPMVNAMVKLFASPKFIIFNLVYMIVTGIVATGLTLGVTRQLLDVGRGGYPEPLRVFSGMRFCLKAWGVQLWTGLKLGLWCLPGIGVLIVGEELVLYDLDTVGKVVAVIGVALMIVLGARALLRYAMAPYILADEPDRGIRDCVRFSTGLMEGRLWQFVKVGIPVLFKLLGAMWLSQKAYNLVAVLVPMSVNADELVMNLLDFAFSVYFVIQMDMISALFYLRTRKPVALDGTPKPVSYWLREHTETDIPEESTETADADEADPVAPSEAAPEADETAIEVEQ